jgi:dTDP-4-dehydrorhamnose reductase
MNKILITGHKGMLGREVVAVAERLNKQVIGMDLPECDITSRRDVSRVVAESDPDMILHIAAFAFVDRCESEPERAFHVNATGTQNLCLAAQSQGIPILYISTDYVFDGKKPEAYDEWDAMNPQTMYGKSKYAGEWFVRALCPMHYIVRTSWLCGHGGANFVETILKLAAEKPEIKVVNDQHGCPTFAQDLAPELLRLIESGAFGTYHITNQGYTTWFEFAGKAVELAGLKAKVSPCTTAEFPRPAPRPANSCLSPRLYDNAIGIRMPGWEEGLKKYIELR